MRLQVAVGAGDVSDFDAEENVAAIVGPVGADFCGLVVGDAAGLDWFRLTAGMRGRVARAHIR